MARWILLLSCIPLAQALASAGQACSFNYPYPWDERPPYVDPHTTKPGVNFSHLLAQYSTPPDPPRPAPFVNPFEAFVNSTRALVEESGRAIGVNLTPEDLLDDQCRGNTHEAASRLLMRQYALEAEARRRGEPFTKAIRDAMTYVTNRTPYLCGPVVRQRIFDPALMRGSATALRDLDGPPAWKEHAWLVLARYHTYALEADEASVYLEKLADSADEALRAQARELAEQVERNRFRPLPPRLTLHAPSHRFRRAYSSCRSNNEENQLLYFRHLLGSAVSDARVAELMQIRSDLGQYRCRQTPEDLPALDAIESRPAASLVAHAYARYLRASLRFYQGRHADALAHFEALAEARDPWIAETARYLRGRIYLIWSQELWNGLSPPESSVDQARVAQGRRALEAYLRQHPDGRYADSARGLLRRATLLEGDRETLTAELEQRLRTRAERLLRSPGRASTDAFLAAFHEWRHHTDRRVDFRRASPLLVAYDVFHARDDYQGRLARLRAERARFESHGDLYALLESFLLYRTGRYDEIDRSVEDTSFASPVSLALGVLRARASTALGDHETARRLWTAIHLSSEERQRWYAPSLEIALSYRAQGSYRAMARAGSHVERRELFDGAFGAVCDVDTLVAIARDEAAHEEARRAARDEAFARHLSRQDFEALHALFTGFDDLGPFAPIQTAVRSLARDPDDPKGLLNVGHFLMVSRVAMPHPITGTFRPHPADPACPTMRSGGRTPGPLDYFDRVVAQHGEDRRSVEDAKALHFIVMCGKPSRRCWRMHGEPLLRGRQAFRRLHRKYRGSKWAERTPYHYDG